MGSTEQDMERFAGAWRLRSFEVENERGQRTFPMGEDADGFILYTQDGFMSGSLMEQGRALFQVDDLMGGSVEEQAMAARGYITYSGCYTIHEDRVRHHVEISLFPNWIGRTQERFFAFEGDELVPSTPPLLLQGKTQTVRLRWRRAGSQRASHRSVRVEGH